MIEPPASEPTYPVTFTGCVHRYGTRVALGLKHRSNRMGNRRRRELRRAEDIRLIDMMAGDAWIAEHKSWWPERDDMKPKGLLRRDWERLKSRLRGSPKPAPKPAASPDGPAAWLARFFTEKLVGKR